MDLWDLLAISVIINGFLFGDQLTRDVISFYGKYFLFHLEHIRASIIKKCCEVFRMSLHHFTELSLFSAGNQSFYGNFEKSVKE